MHDGELYINISHITNLESRSNLFLLTSLLTLTLFRNQLGSRVVRAFVPCLGGWGFDSRPSQTKDFKLVAV